VKEENFFTI